MNCCNHNDNKNPHKRHIPHIVMMILCCGAPFIIVFLISIFGANFPALKAALIPIIPFICPVMMALMIPMMFRGNKNSDCDQKEKSSAIAEDDPANRK